MAIYGVIGMANKTAAVIGTGIMGSEIALNLLKGGFSVRAWNRTPDKLERLVSQGAIPCPTPADAAGGAAFVITMLPDAATTRSVIVGETGAGAGFEPGAIWLQMGTLGLEGTLQLAEIARTFGVAFVDCPVVGSKVPASRGELVVLAAMDEPYREACEALFEPIARKVVWLNETGQASILKLAVNQWIVSVFGLLAESMGYARALGLEPTWFLEALSGGPTWPPAADARAKAMIEGVYGETSWSVDMAVKDARLILAAADEAHTTLPITQAVNALLLETTASGLGSRDIAAVHELWR
jgi:3-hydroxyisobutyrate dehydrogenase